MFTFNERINQKIIYPWEIHESEYILLNEKGKTKK